MLEKFTWYKQSAYRWKGEGITLYIDPWGLTDKEEPADVVFITHAHADHFEPADIAKIRKSTTQFVAPLDVADNLEGKVKAIKPGESLEVAGIKFETVPAYSTVEHRLQTHPKSNNWVGYILTLDGHRYWFSGDGDPNPDIEKVKTDVALICVGGRGVCEGSRAGQSPDHEAGQRVRANGGRRALSPSLTLPRTAGEGVGTFLGRRRLSSDVYDGTGGAQWSISSFPRRRRPWRSFSRRRSRRPPVAA